VVLGLILFLGGALRTVGLDWGLPGMWHPSSYHPDEFRIAQPVANMLEHGVLKDGSRSYGSLFHYLIFAVAKIPWLRATLDPVELIDLARGLCAAFGTATIALAFALVRPLGGPGPALVAALCCAALPGHVLHSHYATVDVPATFFAFLSLAFLGVQRGDGRASTKAIAAAAIAAGLAAATKYPFGIVLLSALARAGLRPWPRALLAVALGPLTFAVVSPLAWMDFAGFWQTAFRELVTHQQEGHGVLFEGTSPWFHLSVNLPYLMGPMAIPLVAFGALAMARRGSALDRALFAYAIPCALILAFAKVRFQRYLFPAMPWLIAALVAPLSWRGHPTIRVVTRWWMGAAVLWMLAIDALLVAALAGQDPRDAASAWFAKHVERGASVGLVRAPGSEGPSLMLEEPPRVVINSSHARQGFLQRNERGELPYRFILCSNWRLRTLREEQPEYFVLSEFHWREHSRLESEQAGRFLDSLADDYALEAEFSSFPRSHRRIFLQTFAPHDWLYPFPTISVYRRR
jgi:hypothetical protein